MCGSMVELPDPNHTTSCTCPQCDGWQHLSSEKLLLLLSKEFNFPEEVVPHFPNANDVLKGPMTYRNRSLTVHAEIRFVHSENCLSMCAHVWP